MMVNQPKFTPKQVIVQSLLLNNMISGAQWYVDMLRDISNRSRPLSPKQEGCLDKAIAKATNTSVPTPAPYSPLTVANHQSLFTLFANAKTHLKRAHIYVPLDLSKPIDKHSDQMKIAIPSTGTSPLWISVKHNGFNYWVGSLDDKGVITFSRRRLNATGINDAVIQATLNELCKDPVGNTAKWGKLLSRCCYCNLPLSTPESLFAGYGDTCAKHYNLPWGKGFGVLSPTQAMTP